MPRIAELDLDQVNKQFDKIDILQSQVDHLVSQSNFAAQQVVIADPIHAPQTTNNLSLTWTGGTKVLSWPLAYIKDKNWAAQTTSRPAAISSAPGQQHIYTIPPGTLTLNPSTYYWIGWDAPHQQMIATLDASTIHGNYAVHIVCQIYTGTTSQTGSAGGGGSTGGVDLSGSRYKNF
jgi:hypothetical protein